MPEGTSQTPAQNKATDAKARRLIPDLSAILFPIFSSPLNIFQAQRLD
jgi:hypothetical protein